MTRLHLLFLLALPACAQIQPGANWDIRTTGSNTNGGFFDASVASPGTDYSQGSPHFTFTDLTIDASNSQKFSSAAHPVDSTFPGNAIYITGTVSGSCVTGHFEVKSQTGGVADTGSNLGNTSSVCNAVLGGSILTIQEALNNAANGNVEWVQSGTYTITSTITSEAGGNRTSPSIIGYGTTHGDNGTKPLITTATNSIPLLTTSNSTPNSNMYLQNLSFSSTAATKSNGMVLGTNAYYVTMIDCDWINLGVTGSNGAVIDLSNGGVAGFQFFHSSITGAAGIGIHANHGTGATVVDSYFYGGGGDAAIENGDIANNPDSLTVDNTIIANNTGAGIQCVAGDHEPCQITVTRSTIVGNGNSGVLYFTNAGATTAISHITMRSNVLYGNTGYGLSVPATSSANPMVNLNLDYNAWGANTTAAYPANVPAGPNDVTLSSDPFTNTAGQDYSLTGSAGALLTGTGYLGAFPAGSTTSHTSIGAFQPAAGGGGGTSISVISQ